MKNSLKFLIETNKLKETPRTGWVLMQLRNPETIADHIFRVAFFSWILGRFKKLKLQKLIKLAIVHDLVETYAGDKTPFLYWEGLDGRKKEDMEILLKGVRLSLGEKSKRGEIKFQNEKKSLLKLTSFLNNHLKKELFLLWLDYEKRISPEGKFIKELDRIETLLQSIEYFGPKEISGGTSWWEGTEEVVEDPLLLELLHTIQNKFYKRKFPRNKKLENVLDFLISIGKLKRMSRTYWTLREIKNPETVAGHIFTLALLVLIFGRTKRHLNMEKLLKMALCHEITAVYTKDTLPYYVNVPKDKKEREEAFKTLPRHFKEEKVKKFSADYKLEEAAIKKVVVRLQPSLQKEMIQLWKEYRNKSSLEGNFLSQLNVIAVLLQALLYKRENKNFSASAIWEWAFESCDDVLCSELLTEIKKEFGK